MKFKVKCLGCGKTYSEDSYVTTCENGCDALLRTDYHKKNLEVDTKYPGIWKYINWLPIKKINPSILQNSSDFSIQNGGAFANHLGLKNLIICYNLYNPNANQTMRTGTFKDIEAEMSFQRLFDSRDVGKILVVSSDGNIATAFNYYSKIINYPVLLFITEEARQNRVWSFWEKNNHVKVITLGKGYDYSDAISFSGLIGKFEDFLLEGGTRNVARRDGIGTIMLDVSHKLGKMPDHYFQALGSGPGAIAMYEASLRLKEDGNYGKKLPKIHGSQNLPFAPMYEAWQKKSNCIDEKYKINSSKQMIKKVYAHVLTNRFPHYKIKGGVFDALNKTNGEFYGISNGKAKEAKKLFKKLEDISIAPPAAVAVASLIYAVQEGRIDKQDTILLNITGGQRDLIDKPIYRIDPFIKIDKKYDLDKIILEVKKWKRQLKLKENI